MTPILQVITQYCYIYVDDIRMAENKENDPPLFAWEMWQLFKPSISLFKIPAEMTEYLTGDNITEPTFQSVTEEVATPQTEPFTIAAPSGYDLCACRIKTETATGRTILTPVAVSYDADMGEVTVQASESNPISGTLELDFYKDGYFLNDLSYDIMNILGMCFQVVWTNRFNTNWLSLIPKIEDKSFFEQNRANKMNADTARLEFLRNQLYGEMRRYATNLRYKKTVPANRKVII